MEWRGAGGVSVWEVPLLHLSHFADSLPFFTRLAAYSLSSKMQSSRKVTKCEFPRGWLERDRGRGTWNVEWRGV